MMREQGTPQGGPLSPLLAVTADLEPLIRGWGNYFKLAAIGRLSQSLDEWIRHRLRCYRLKRCKRPKGIWRFLEGIGCKRILGG